MNSMSYEDLLELLISRGCHNFAIQFDRELVKLNSMIEREICKEEDIDHFIKDVPTEAAVIATQAIIAQSLDQIDNRMYHMVNELVRIATALEQKSHECP